MYERAYEDTRYLIICSFSDQAVRVRIPKEYVGRRLRLVLCNYPKGEREELYRVIRRPDGEQGWFLPYEASNLMGSLGGIKELFKGE